jgi:hypothetical protein
MKPLISSHLSRRFYLAAALIAALALLFVMLPVHAEDAPVITDVQMYANGKALNLNSGEAVSLATGSTLSVKVFGKDSRNDTNQFTWQWYKGKNPDADAAPVSTDARYTLPRSESGSQTYTVIYSDKRDGSAYTCMVNAKIGAKPAGIKKATRFKIASTAFSLPRFGTH